MPAYSLSRRSLIKSLAAGTTLPGLLQASLSRQAQAAGVRKLLMIYLPDGYGDFSDWHPDAARTTAGSLRAGDLKAASTALSPVVDKLTLIDGLKLHAAGNTHEGGCIKVLNGQQGNPNSIDVDIGKKTSTPFPYLALGVGSKFEGANDGLTVENGSTVDAFDNPGQILSKLGVPAPGGTPGTKNLTSARMAAALEVALLQGQRLRSQVGGISKSNLNTTLSSLEAERARVMKSMDAPTPMPGGGCDASMLSIKSYGDTGYPKPYHQNAVRMEVAEQQFKVAKFALQCGVTRVVNLHWGHKVSNYEGWHGKSHGQWAEFRQVRAPVLAQVVRWAQDLETSGMLSDTVIFCYSEIGHSNLHDHDRVPFFLIGGGLGNGRALDYRGTNKVKNAAGESECHTKLLVSLARWMGDAAKTQHGYTGHGTGPLPNFPIG